MSYLYQILEQNATWRTLAILFALAIPVFIGFEWRKRKLGKHIVTFDGRWAYTRAEARDLLEEMGPGNRWFYAVTQLSLDLVFPVLYNAFFAVLLFIVFPAPGYLLLIPLVV